MSIYNKINELISKVKHTYKEDAARASEYDAIDHSFMILESERLLRLLTRQSKVHKFLGISKENFEKAIESGTSKKRKIRHIVTGYDTLFSISNQYKIEPEELLQLNNLKAGELTPGREITIEVEDDLNPVTGIIDLPVIGEHRDKERLGRDLEVTLLPSSNGDLNVLAPEATVKQGIRLRLNSRKGDYPMNPGFGIDDYMNNDFPKDLKLLVIDKEAEVSIDRDRRISQIDYIGVTQSTDPKTAGNIEINAEVTTIA